jgi:hypothetical protein
MNRRSRLGPAMACLLVSATATLYADTISVELPFGLFGQLANEGPLCACTSLMNSFVYLKNRFPEVYGGTR